MSARLDDDAYDGLRLFCRAHGVTMAGLLNALGEELSSADERPPAWARRLIERGREIDAERRQRPSP